MKRVVFHIDVNSAFLSWEAVYRLYHLGAKTDLREEVAAVGGDIQAVYPYEDPVALICNEEGKLMGLPLNRALFDDDGEEVFRVGTTIGKGSISTYGASFSSASKNGEAKATITMEIPVDVSDAEAYAEDTVGVAIINLNRVEAKLEEALASVRQEKTEIRNNITVL